LLEGFPDKTTDEFFLTINHPLEDDIFLNNVNTENDSGKILFTGDEGRESSIILHGIMLPFQGFELSWKIK